MWEPLWRGIDGSTVYFDYDETTDTVSFRREMDIEPVMDAAKQAFNEPVDRKSEFRHVMTIPVNVAMNWRKAQGFGEDWYERIFGAGNEAVLARLVHDRDLSHFRTMPGNFEGSFRRR